MGLVWLRRVVIDYVGLNVFDVSFALSMLGMEQW